MAAPGQPPPTSNFPPLHPFPGWQAPVPPERVLAVITQTRLDCPHQPAPGPGSQHAPAPCNECQPQKTYHPVLATWPGPNLSHRPDLHVTEVLTLAKLHPAFVAWARVTAPENAAALRVRVPAAEDANGAFQRVWGAAMARDFFTQPSCREVYVLRGNER